MLGRPPGRHRASCLPLAARAGCRPTPWLVYFRVMGAWARRRWSAVKSLPQDSVLFANVLESGPFSQGQHGCVCKNSRESAGTLADNAGLRGKASFLPAQTAGAWLGRARRKGVPLRINPSIPPLPHRSAVPKLRRTLQVPFFRKGTSQWGRPSNP